MCYISYSYFKSILPSLHTYMYRLLLDHGANTTLPDSNGRLINIPGFAGTQVLIKTSRKQKKRRIMSALQNKLPLKEFKKIWQVRGWKKRGREREGEGGRERESPNTQCHAVYIIQYSTERAKVFKKDIHNVVL